MTHRKFHRLARHFGSIALARGILELLWDGCYESGDDYLGTAADIDLRIGWNGEPGAVALALVACGLPEGHGFIEPVQPDAAGEVTYRVHDLWHHAPEYVSNRRQKEMERQHPKNCARCAEPYFSADPRSKYCSPACRQGGWRDRNAHIRNTPLLETDHNGTPAPAPAPTPALIEKASRVSPADIVSLWNELVTPPIPKVTKVTSDRSKKLNDRLSEYPDLATWRTVISWLNAQAWCRASGTGDHPNWTATLDWLCKSDGNFRRQLEKATALAAHPARVEDLTMRQNMAKYGGQR